MIFYYNGKKPSTTTDLASGCLIIIAIGATIFAFSVMDSIEDITDHIFELAFIAFMLITTLYGIFRKKGKLHTNKIEITPTDLRINQINIPLNNITLDIYKKDTHFSRYHLWDSKGTFAVYSVFEDDLLSFFGSNFSSQTFTHIEESSFGDLSQFSIKAKNRKLTYNLETGDYIIESFEKVIAEYLPSIFVYDAKYKAGIPLEKKEKN